jgi:hypothetical protein
MIKYRECAHDNCVACKLCGVTLIFSQKCPCRTCIIYANCSKLCADRVSFYKEVHPYHSN